MKITIDTRQSQEFQHYLRDLSYRDFNRHCVAIARQAARDVHRVYKPFVPQTQNSGPRGKYGFTSGNLRRSLDVFRKRQKDPFIVEFSVGFKTHRYGELAARQMRGQKSKDGYYGAMVSKGMAGRDGRSIKSKGFHDHARGPVNNVLNSGLSNRAEEFIMRRLKKLANGNGI